MRTAGNHVGRALGPDSPAVLEPLEGRLLLSLLGIQPGYPSIFYDSTGELSYNAAAQALDVDATPLQYRLSQAHPPKTVFELRDLQIHVKVDNSGNLIGGVPGDDLVVTGGIDLDGNGAIDPSETGVLLTGEIMQFGWAEVSASLDKYDFRFRCTGGILKPSWYAGQDIAITLDSGPSSFTGVFTVNFGGGAKGYVGPIPSEIPPPEVEIDIEKYVKPVQPCGGEGLTPGYWKQPQHFDDWTAPYDPYGSRYEVVFGVDVPGSNPTLLNALQAKGGGMNALLRHSTAALLNAAHPGIDYAYAVDQVIAMVQGAFANGNFEEVKNLFEEQNELEADLSDPAPPCPPPDMGYGYDADDPYGPDVPTIPAGWTVLFTYVVTNPGEVALANITVTDDKYSPQPVLSGGFNVGDLNQDDLLDVGEEWLYTATCIAAPGLHANLGTVTGWLGDVSVSDEDPAHYLTPYLAGIHIEKYVKTEQPCGGEGLTPGYWKQPQHFDDWTAPYQPYFSGYEAAFNLPAGTLPGGDKMLLEALCTGGGGVNALLRHSTAALLNAAHPGIDYAYSVDQIIAMVQAAFAPGGDIEGTKNLFEAGNEMGADLRDCGWIISCPPPPCPPGDDYGDDADEPTGPHIPVGREVLFTYVVTNTGQVPLLIVVTDDRIQPQPVLVSGFNIGDLDQDGLLDVGEKWLYTATEQAAAGQQVNVGTAVGTPVNDAGQPIGDDVADSDPAHYFGFATGPTLASIGDFVWHDMYHGCGHLVDGIQDAGEPGIRGVLVILVGAGPDDAFGTPDDTSDSTTTDASGYYEFSELAPGRYIVEIALSNFEAGGALAGWYATLRDRGADDADSDGDMTTHRSGVIDLAAGEHDDTVDFGFFRTGIELTKTGPEIVYVGQAITYHFRVVNTGDVVLHGGAQVYDLLLEPDGSPIWDGVLLPGQVVTFDRTYTKTCLPGTITNAATATGHPVRPDGVALENVHDESAWTVSVLSACKAAVGDFVWEDLDGDGLQDAGEPGIEGVKVDLLNAWGHTVATTTTGADGRYLFDSLAPGDYRVRFTAPQDFDFTKKDVGGDWAVDSDADPLSGSTALFTLKAGQVLRTIDAGLVRKAQCGGEGLTPGYWKQKQHFDEWVGYKQTDRYLQVFQLSKDDVSCKRTLLDALKLGGGGENALARHAVAALLNAADPNVNYRYTQAEVIEMVQYAYRTGKFEMIKNLLEAENELGLS